MPSNRPSRRLVRVGLALAALLALGAAGAAQAQATASLAPANLAFGNVVISTDSAPRNVTITNTSAAASFTVSAISISSRYREVTGGSCPARPFALVAGTSCTVAVVFNPNSPGSFPASLSVTATTPVTFNPASVNIGGSGVPVPMSLAPATLAFGNVEIGATSPPQTVTLRNDDGAATVTVSAISISSRYSEAAGGTCGARPFNLGPGASCTLRVVFEPNSAGSFPASLSFTTAPSSQVTPASVAIGGTGVPIPATLAPANLAFGNVSIGTTSAAQSVTVTNASAMSAPFTVSAISISSRYDEVAGGTCPLRPFVLAAGESCTVRLAFSPNSAGSFPASVSVTTSPSSTFTPASVGISGSGTPLPATLAPGTMAFGGVTVGATSPPRFATIANADPVGSFTVTTISVSSRYSIAAGGTCTEAPFPLAAGESCTVAVVFAPNSLGSFPASLSISTSPSTTATPSSIAIAGAGTPVPGLFMPATLNFGSVVVGNTSATQALTLANADPDAPMTITAISLTSRYSVVGGSCGTVPFLLAPGANCTLSLQFAPNSLGAFPSILSVSTSPSSSFVPLQVSVGGSGVSDALFEDGFED